MLAAAGLGSAWRPRSWTRAVSSLRARVIRPGASRDQRRAEQDDLCAYELLVLAGLAPYEVEPMFPPAWSFGVSQGDIMPKGA